MRKIYLLAGLLFVGVSVFAQPDLNDPRNARVIFNQTFEVKEGLTEEQAYAEWSQTPIDTIHEIEYYSKIGTSSVSSGTDIYDGSADWEIFAVRTDSTSSDWTETNPGDGIVMFNGADPTSSASEIANGIYDNDRWRIVGDPNGLDQARIDAFKQYGVDGGNYYFQWETGDISKARAAGNISSSHYSSGTRSTKNYRRTLYVRGLDIEDESSYRLTFYIKAQKLNSWNPLFYADVMRGYHHQRAAFSMGYKSGKEFSLKMEDGDLEDNVWQKVTMMTYYINAHEADAYVFYKGDYSWADDWTWHPSQDLWPAGKTLADGDDLNYIKQPDKFFVRLSFCTDSIIYSLDNLSLTKSWIAGCEYHQDKLRVDFGYETNLDELVKEAKAKTNIAAVEVPDEDGKYFQVWCLKKGGDPNKTTGGDFGTGDWDEMYIRSAEYHEDGYMYMFTDFYDDPITGEQTPYQFEDYDQVLVTFHNPTDLPGLTLKYTGSLYPKALDSAWVADGKIVPDFYNELATPNPYAFDGVLSMTALPPVLQDAPFEEGSFGLDGSIRELRFKFSKEVEADVNFKGEQTNNVVAYVNDEVWIPSWSAADSSLVITRPDGLAATALKGDYEVKLIQIHARGGANGENVVYHYHFGEFSKTSDITQISSDWRSASNFDKGGYNPPSTYVHDGNTTFRKGGTASKGKTRVYAMAGTYPNDCGYVITQYVEKASGNMYSIVHFDKAEDLTIEFLGTGWAYSGSKAPGLPCYLYFYPAPGGTLENGDDKGFTDLEACEKTALGSFTPKTVVQKGNIEDKDTGTWPDEVETFKFNFTVPSAGDYVFEWVTKDAPKADVKSGVFISNYTVKSANAGDLSTMYVGLINDIYGKAVEKKAEVDAAERDYKGTLYNAFVDYMATFKENAFKETAPSAYNSNYAAMSSAISEMQARMDTVDLFCTTETDARKKLAGLAGDSTKLAVYKALDAHLKANESIVFSEKETSYLTAEINAYKAEMTAVDDRLALISKFADKIAQTKAVIDGAERKDYDEYAGMVNGYNTASEFDVISTTDDELVAAFDELAAAQRGYVFKYDYYIATTRQIKELYALAVDLGYEFGSDIKAKVDAVEDEDAELSTLLREAAILQILNIYNDADPSQLEKFYNYNVSALIPNYYLRNDADIDRDMKQRSSGEWYIKRNANSDIIPGWTLTPNSSSGYWYFTTAKVDDPYVAASYTDWKVDGHVFIGGLRSATSTKGVISTTVTGLPEGLYKVGLYAYNQTSDLAFEFKTDSVTLSGKVNEVMNDGKKFTFKEVGVDSVMVAGDLVYTIDQKSSSSSEFDMRSAALRLQGINPDCDYEAALQAQETKMNELLTIVDARQAVKEGVEYYTIGGIKLDAPKSGQILIRKTTQNGKVVVDKVLIK